MAETTFNQRFKKILQNYNLKSAEAARLMNVNRQVTDSYLKESLPRLDMLIVLLRTFPELNVNWVIFGEGEMIEAIGTEGKTAKSQSSADLDLIKRYWDADREELTKLREQNRILMEELLSLRTGPSAKAAG